MAPYTAQDLKLDYFKFYDVADQPAGYIVGLQGQFDKEPEKAQVTRLNLFANPASKNGEPIYDKNAHLSFYNLYDPVPDPVRKVAFENQFGSGTLITGRTMGLMTPTQRVFEGSQFPQRLDHYKVYQVLQAEPLNKEVKLQDQFGTGSAARVLIPRLFAVPVKKWWEGQTFGIHNEKAHLVMYQLYPDSTQETIKTRDQFSPRILQVFRGVFLGVPSVKTKWSEMD